MKSTATKIKEKMYSCVTSVENLVNVVIYARVSTTNEGQAESCNNQVALCEDFLCNHPNVNIVGVFVDDGLSGKNTNRPEYQKMMSLVSRGGADLIVSKSTSRLNRNPVNAILLANVCMQNFATLLTVEDGQMYDFEDESSMMMYSIKTLTDANTVKVQTRSGKSVQKNRIIKKELSAKDISTGYNWNKEHKQITINEEEAEIVREIFEDYVFRSMMPADIVEKLKNKGIVNRFSKKPMCTVTIKNILTDERYIGKFYINKRSSYVVYGDKQHTVRTAVPKEKQILIERPELRIVDDELFELAQRLRASRQTIYNTNDYHITRQKFEGKHLFAGKIKCGCCGASLNFRYADRAETIPVYRVNSHSHCENKDCRIKESDASEMVASSIKAVFEAENDAISRVEHLLYENLHKNENEGELRQIERNITHLNKEIADNSRPLTDPDILANKMLKDTFLSKIKEAQDRIASLEARKKELSVSMDTSAIEERISHLRSAIAEFKEVKELSRERILRNVKEIVMNADGSVSITLSSGISFKRSVDKYQIQDALC